MPGCGAVTCTNRSEKGFKLYALPSGDRNKVRTQLWAKNIGRDPLPEKTYVCEVHFTADQFELNRADGKRKLRWNAVPTEFIDQKVPAQRKSAKQLQSDAERIQTPVSHPDLLSHVIENARLMPDADHNISTQGDGDSGYAPKLKHELCTAPNETELKDMKNMLQNVTNISAKCGRSPNDILNTEKQQQVQPFDLTKVCRICFGKTQLEDIFAGTYQKHTLHSLLEICSTVKIDKNTSYRLICVKCKTLLIQAYLFVRKVIASNDSLQFAELNRKKSVDVRDRSDDSGCMKMEEIFIFVDEGLQECTKLHQIFSEYPTTLSLQHENSILEKCSNKIIRNVDASLIHVAAQSASELLKIKSESEDEVESNAEPDNGPVFTSKLSSIAAQQETDIFDESFVHSKDFVAHYYLIKADENTLANFVHEGNIFRLPETDLGRLLPHLIGVNEVSKHSTIFSAKSGSKIKKSPVENKSSVPFQELFQLRDHTYVEKCENEKSGSCYIHKKSYLCEKCGVSLSSIPNLRVHIRRIHEGVKSTYSKCRKCNVLFRSQAAYETHRSQHIGKHHCCETCGKLFAGMSHLRQHLRRHTSLRPFRCGICSKSFRAKYLLNYHTVRHTKEKKHACLICSDTYLKLSDLRSHITKVHQEKKRTKLFRCDQCNYKGFKRKTLQTHVKNVHLSASEKM